MLELNINQEIIKLSNKTRVLNLIAEKGETTKQEIAEVLKLSIPTVITNVNILLEEGLIEKAGIAESTGGRKPEIIRFKPDAKYTFGVDISPKKLTVILTNLNSEILAEQEVDFDEKKLLFNDIILKSHKIIEKVIDDKEIPKNKILGVGFSLPGIIDEEELILQNAPNLKVKNFDFKPYKEIFKMPIYIENEANAAAIGEATLGAAKDKSNLVYISITEGIGAGIIIHNRLYKSTSKKAGEIGHMRITDEELKCNCGRTGCWELYASERALIEKFNCLSSHQIKKISEFFDSFNSGDELAAQILEKYLEYLSIGIENIILALSPENIIIGGEVSKYEKLYRDILLKKLKEQKSLYEFEEINISFSKLKGKASLLGASFLVKQHLFSLNNQAI